MIDVQGVGDLLTDPQIHTLSGSGYGRGNMGLRGMALFFATHKCNAICAQLGCTPFAKAAPSDAATVPADATVERLRRAREGSSRALLPPTPLLLSTSHHLTRHEPLPASSARGARSGPLAGGPGSGGVAAAGGGDRKHAPVHHALALQQCAHSG